MSLDDTDLKLLSKIKEHIQAIEPDLPNQEVLTIGQYAYDLVDKSFLGDEHTDLIRVHHKKDLEYKTIIPDAARTLEIDTEYEPHYWFDLYSQIEDDELVKRFEEKIYRYHKNIYTITNIGEGTASGFLPKLHNFIYKKEKNRLGIVVFPSMTHSSDALFNAFSCTGLIQVENSTPLLFIDQDNLENYKGVYRTGKPLNGIEAVEYILDIFLEKDGFLHDFNTISKNFNITNFSPLLASGCSLDIYESLVNILDITLEQPMLNIDLSTSTFLYVLLRCPVSLSKKFTKGYLEYEVSQWLNSSVGIDIPQICDTIFKEEYGDRIDVLVLFGGIDMSPMFEVIYERIKRFSQMNLDQNLVDPDVWGKLKRKLLDN
jgi:hypothetical protein